MSPPSRMRPAGENGAHPTNSISTADSSPRNRSEDGYAAPDAEARAEAAFLAEAEARGFRLSLTCLDCGHPIVTEASLRRHRGPRCAARAQAVIG